MTGDFMLEKKCISVIKVKTLLKRWKRAHRKQALFVCDRMGKIGIMIHVSQSNLLLDCIIRNLLTRRQSGMLAI